MISVVIPTYNEEKFLEKTLQRLSKQTLPRNKYEIIVVDGNSTDKTRQIAKKYADKVIMQKTPMVPGARNDAIKVAKHDLIATTDADVLVPKNWLEKFVEDFSDKDVIAVCGVDEPRERNLKSVVTFKFLRKVIDSAAKLNYYCLGSTNTAFRKDIFLKIGGYKLLPYSDDAYLSFRFRKLGKIVYDKSLKVKVSTRRFEKYGYLKVLWIWFKGDLKLLLGKNLEDINYFKQQY